MSSGGVVYLNSSSSNALDMLSGESLVATTLAISVPNQYGK